VMSQPGSLANLWFGGSQVVRCDAADASAAVSPSR